MNAYVPDEDELVLTAKMSALEPANDGAGFRMKGAPWQRRPPSRDEDPTSPVPTPRAVLTPSGLLLDASEVGLVTDDSDPGVPLDDELIEEPVIEILQEETEDDETLTLVVPEQVRASRPAATIGAMPALPKPNPPPAARPPARAALPPIAPPPMGPALGALVSAGLREPSFVGVEPRAPFDSLGGPGSRPQTLAGVGALPPPRAPERRGSGFIAPGPPSFSDDSEPSYDAVPPPIPSFAFDSGPHRLPPPPTQADRGRPGSDYPRPLPRASAPPPRAPSFPAYDAIDGAPRSLAKPSVPMFPPSRPPSVPPPPQAPSRPAPPSRRAEPPPPSKPAATNPPFAWPSQRSARGRAEPDPLRLPPETLPPPPPSPTDSMGMNGTIRMEPLRPQPSNDAAFVNARPNTPVASPNEAPPRVNLSAPVPVHPAPPPEPWPRVALNTPRRVVEPAPVPATIPESRRPSAAPAADEPLGGHGGKIALALGAISLVLSILLAVLLLSPSHGRLRIALIGEGSMSIPKAEVFIDGEKKCDFVPCYANDLGPGPKTIQVLAPGFDPAVSVDNVEAGKERLVVITMKPAGATGAPASTAAVAGGGDLVVGSCTAPNARVIVDGADRSSVPAHVMGLAPGMHRVRVDAGDRYEAFERSVEIGRGTSADLGAIQLKVLKARVVVDNPSGDSARVVLTDVETKEETTLKGPWPAAKDVNGTHRWLVSASERGMRDFNSDVAFDDGQAEKKVHIAFERDGQQPQPVAARGAPASAPAPRGRPAPRDSDDSSDTSSKPTPSGTGTLNINSLPASKVLVDGRPLGSTPKVGVQVSAGTHTVTFIHPDLGTKTLTVNVAPGQEASAGVRFKRDD